MTLIGKIALVTGASRGIGRAVALDLAMQGATVIGTATTQAGAEEITELLAKHQLSGQGCVLQLADSTSRDAMLEELKASCGMPNILVNNAGVTRDNIALRMRPEEWDEVINTDLSAVFYLTKSCLKPMLKARWGRVITISSVVALTGNPGQANYAAAKAGLLGLSKSIAQEVASRHITVNVVAPGFIDTDMTKALSEQQQQAILSSVPMERLGKVEDIAAAVSFLASERAGYITGNTLHVNGGMYMQ